MDMKDTASPSRVPVLTLKPTSGWAFPDFGEIWSYRELLYFLVLRDIRVRYRQTFLGFVWAVIQPLSLAAAFTLVFGKIAGVSSHGIPYPLFAYCALVPWTLFSQALSGASGSLVGGASIISKVYFPRVVVPLASATSFLLDFIIAMAILAVMMAYYGVLPSTNIIFLPLLTAMSFLSAFAVGVWLSALNVRYRDVRYAVPFILQLLLFASPLGYSVAEVEGWAKFFLALNPVTGIAEGFRWSLLGTPPPAALYFVVPLLGTCVVLVGGLLYFHRTERTFADLI